MAPTMSTYTSGYNTPDSELESILPIHPTAVRRPYAITVQSENTVYSDEHITAKFANRGSEVTVSDGNLTIKPTIQKYEFQTKRAVSKTGSVIFFLFANFIPIFLLLV
jgi:myo-inositol-1-phosphate synthase